MTKLLVAGLAVLAAVAVADTIRRESAASTAPSSASAPPQRVVHPVTSGFVAVGPGTRTRVLLNGREYVSARQVDAAFPAPLEGVPFDIAHVASASDGTVALAVYKIPVTGPARAAIELWRGGKLVGAFTVPTGSFGGGLGFADDGRLVAGLSPDGLRAALFTRAGRPAGTVSATSW